ncbi:hypothetical protein LSAT2_010200 [Lamellibrachia satsuma]|nr:hypothetical protein LSAT2_010200 [Lamellibrachia satsuma]
MITATYKASTVANDTSTTAVVDEGTLLCIVGTVSAINELPNLGLVHMPPPPRYRPFCYCRPGFEWRPYARWPFCRCYKFVRDLATWAEARTYCQVLRGNMMEVKDSATQFWLQSKLIRKQASYSHHLLEKAEYWLGATDLEQESKWTWDHSYSNMGYLNWLTGEPNNYVGYQNCLAIKRRLPSRRSYGWFDDDCYQKKFYICERRGWYCWGWQCWRKYSARAKTIIPLSVARARKAEGPQTRPAAAEKAAFEV